MEWLNRKNKPNGYWNYEHCYEEAKKYKTRTEFEKNNGSCYQVAIKNGWIDDKGRVFIYYSVKSVCEDLNCGTQKACKLLDELEKAGALERKRQGPGKPNKLYLMKVF